MAQVRTGGKGVVFFFGARVFSYLCHKPKACMQYELNKEK